MPTSHSPASHCDPVEVIPSDPGSGRLSGPEIMRLAIEGLRCEHCATRIRNALWSTPHPLGVEIPRRRDRSRMEREWSWSPTPS